MRERTKVAPSGEPPAPVPPMTVSRKRIARRLLADRLSRRLVTLGGVAIIASILAILLVIAAEIIPLFKAPSVKTLQSLSIASGTDAFTIGVDEYREVAYLVTRSGIQVLSLKDGTPLPSPHLPGLRGATVTASSAPIHGVFTLGLSDGRIIPVEVTFSVSYPEGTRQITPEFHITDPIAVDPQRRPIRRLAHAAGGDGPVIVASVGDQELILLTVKETTPLIGPATKEVVHQTLPLTVDGEISALTLDRRGGDLFVGTSSGQLIGVDLSDPRAPQAAEAVTVTHGSGISALALLLGDRSVVVGDGAGAVSTWQWVQTEGGAPRLTRMNDFGPHTASVVAIAPSLRDKGFVTADLSGTVQLHYGTTGRTLLATKTERRPLQGITFAPKADGILSVDQQGTISHWTVSNPHPEITLRSLFGKIWYEGYQKPTFVWQSTGGSDDFEAKFSLVPLIFGTLKGTLYALLFAVPFALFGALFTSQFMHPALKGIVKPAVEIMAALPSVVLGFLAGLWLAPRVEQVVPGLFLMPVLNTFLILLAVYGWQYMPNGLRRRMKTGSEVALLVPIVLLGSWIAFQLGSMVEHLLLSGDYRGWLLNVLGLTYDQRNSLVVGIAMGFAVIPIIFTIAEDALSNVPSHLVAGSLALGATRWQTAIRVVLPTASPGIFSAIMIGLGRAVGETMIVLMATGNTPVMDWSVFNGFRALSANIAVELPEAPEGGTLFRVLFLAAFLLFVMTFLLNTVAELVRLKLRQRYRYL